MHARVCACWCGCVQNTLEQMRGHRQHDIKLSKLDQEALSALQVDRCVSVCVCVCVRACISLPLPLSPSSLSRSLAPSLPLSLSPSGLRKRERERVEGRERVIGVVFLFVHTLDKQITFSDAQRTSKRARIHTHTHTQLLQRSPQDQAVVRRELGHPVHSLCICLSVMVCLSMCLSASATRSQNTRIRSIGSWLCGRVGRQQMGG
jgi:hypothetical protein